VTSRRIACTAVAAGVIFAACAARAAAADPRAVAAAAYRSGRYPDAIRALRAELPRLTGEAAGRQPVTRAEALYLLGRLELRRGELALELGRAAARYSVDHLSRLIVGPSRLRYATYFLGAARLEAGDRAGAEAAWRQVEKLVK